MKELLGKIKKHSIIYDKKRILKNYYSKAMRKGKTYRASLMDQFVLITILYIGLIVTLYIKTNKFLLSFYMSSIILYFLGICFFKIYKKVKSKKTNVIKENLKREKLLKELSNLKHAEFKTYVKDLFEKYYDTNVEYEEFPIDLKCKIEGEEYKIKCFKLDDKEKVYLRDIDIFLKELKNIGLDEGIIVTNSSFTEDVKEISNIMAYDLEKIINMIKQTDFYPEDDEIEEYIIENFIDNRSEMKKQIKSLNVNKIIKLYIVSIIFYIFSYIVVYKFYYKIASLSTFIIATLLLAYKFSEYIIIKDRSPFR